MRLDDRIEAQRIYCLRHSRSWLDLEQLAQGYMDRARLSGDYGDYALAEEALARAFRVVPEGSGPLMTRASLNFTLHRLSRVEPDLAALRRGILNRAQRESIDALSADVAFHSGRYPEALRGYEAMLAADRSPVRLVALAQYRWKTGDFASAEWLLTEAAALSATGEPETRAWVCLVRGLMELDRGRWDAALGHYRAGIRLRPESWVLQEHEAEVLTLQGHTDDARRKYIALIERTGDPEFMDALAEIETSRRDPGSAARWIARARVVHDSRVTLFPEAAAGHALDHYLRNDPARAVTLAEHNRDTRPGGEAWTRLAEAYLRVGRREDARRAVEAVLATPWNTAEMHAVASVIYRHIGESALADTERARAVALNPHAMDDADAMLPSAAPHGEGR